MALRGQSLECFLLLPVEVRPSRPLTRSCIFVYEALLGNALARLARSAPAAALARTLSQALLPLNDRVAIDLSLPRRRAARCTSCP